MALAPPTDPAASPALVSALLAEQAPALADLPVTWLATGWDNDTYRLGELLAVRLPRHEQGATLHTHETHWLPLLGPTLTARTPQPAFVGVPSERFPHPWAVVDYIPGATALELPVEESASFAEDLADLLWSLHQPAPTHAPVNPFRGGSLATPDADARVRERLARLARTGDAALANELLPRWKAWTAGPDFDGVDVWLHGDLHPGNLVVGPDGHLAGVIDWGDLTSGDPACDLATAWLTFDETGRRAFTERANQGGAIEDATWLRARAWALHLALVMTSRPDQHRALADAGRRALGALAGEPVGRPILRW